MIESSELIGRQRCRHPDRLKPIAHNNLGNGDAVATVIELKLLGKSIPMAPARSSRLPVARIWQTMAPFT
jgi:hypothetical protein